MLIFCVDSSKIYREKNVVVEEIIRTSEKMNTRLIWKDKRVVKSSRGCYIYSKIQNFTLNHINHITVNTSYVKNLV